MLLKSAKMIKIVFVFTLFMTILSETSFAQCACSVLDEDFGSTSSCTGFSQTTSNAAIKNHSQQNYSPGGANDDPNDGEYSIRCDGDENNAGWFGAGGSTMTDHTVDAAGQTGNYAIINSTDGPVEFYHKTVTGLCASTSYTLTYYAGNLVKNSAYGLLPSLKTYVFPAGSAVTGVAAFTGTGGTLLGSSGTIPSETAASGFKWNTYSYTFTTGAGVTSMDVVLVSLNGNNAGGDFAFDDVTVTKTSGGCTAPVELLSFTAERAPQNIILRWSTASEANFSHFIIEKSTDGINFEPIGTIQGAGNSSHQIDYSFIDNSISQGFVYYRLKQVDLDGTSKYSAISSVNVDTTSSVLFYSSDGDLIIQFTATGEATYTVIDMQGKTLYSSNRISDESFITVSKNNFKNGTYIAKVQMGTEVVTKKVTFNY
jgi:hypothetical protein